MGTIFGSLFSPRIPPLVSGPNTKYELFIRSYLEGQGVSKWVNEIIRVTVLRL